MVGSELEDGEADADAGEVGDQEGRGDHKGLEDVWKVFGSMDRGGGLERAS
jgi:hypothetical protein